MSLGGSEQSDYLQQAIADAERAHITVVVTAGNGRSVSVLAPPVGYDIDSQPFYPASYKLPNLLAVAALGVSTDLASFSNWGEIRSP